MRKYTRTYQCSKCLIKRDTKFPKIETSEDCYCPDCNAFLHPGDIIITKRKIKKYKKKRDICPKEGVKCKHCKTGKVIHHKNTKITGKNKAMCSNPKCDRYYICKACGLPFGTHFIK